MFSYLFIKLKKHVVFQRSSSHSRGLCSRKRSALKNFVSFPRSLPFSCLLFHALSLSFPSTWNTVAACPVACPLCAPPLCHGTFRSSHQPQPVCNLAHRENRTHCTALPPGTVLVSAFQRAKLLASQLLDIETIGRSRNAFNFREQSFAQKEDAMSSMMPFIRSVKSRKMYRDRV